MAYAYACVRLLDTMRSQGRLSFCLLLVVSLIETMCVCTHTHTPIYMHINARAHTQVGIDRMMEQSLQTNTYTQWYALVSSVVCFTYYLTSEWPAVLYRL